MKDCPVCGHRLRFVGPSEVDEEITTTRFADEDVYWCKICRVYIYEEDFLYDTSEEN